MRHLQVRDESVVVVTISDPGLIQAGDVLHADVAFHAATWNTAWDLAQEAHLMPVWQNGGLAVEFLPSDCRDNVAISVVTDNVCIFRHMTLPTSISVIDFGDADTISDSGLTMHNVTLIGYYYEMWELLTESEIVNRIGNQSTYLVLTREPTELMENESED